MDLRVGVVGCGRHANRVILPELRDAGFRVAATCSRRLEAASETARRFGAGRAFDDPATMIEAVDLDAVALVLPRHAYRAVFDGVSAAGFPTFIEKPGAASAAELAEMEARATAPVLVGYMKRFAPAYAGLRDRAWSADPSQPPATSMRMEMAIGEWPHSVHDLVFEVASHAVDLAQFLLGPLRAVDVTCRPGRPASLSIDLEDVDGRGVTATLDVATTSTWDRQREVVVLRGQGWEARVDQESVPGGVPGSEGFAVELRHFAEVVRGNEPSAVPVAAAHATMRTLEDVVARL